MTASIALSIAVRALVEHAINEKMSVSLALRDDAAAHGMFRTVVGRPLAITTGRDGRERVQVEIASGESQQIVPLDRIAHVRFDADATDPG